MFIHQLGPKGLVEFLKRLFQSKGGRVHRDGDILSLEREADNGHIHRLTIDLEMLCCIYVVAQSGGDAIKTVEGELSSIDNTLKLLKEPSLKQELNLNPTLAWGLPRSPSLLVQALHLRDFRGVRDLYFVPRKHGATVLTGDNGAGKSSILDALALSLSWLIKRIENRRSLGQRPCKSDIRNQADHCKISVRVGHYDWPISWTLVEKEKGSESKESSDLSSLKLLLDDYALELRTPEENLQLPVVVNYPVQRAASVTSKAGRKKQKFHPFDAYLDAIVSETRDFRHFFDWFRDRENLENEGIRDRGRVYRDPQLEAVRRAIEGFVGLQDLRIRRSPQLRMVANKKGEELGIEQLSVGEKVLFAMVGDLARRLALANPKTANPLLGCGIVIIDEVELHLHPSWQRTVVERLEQTFPRCQFLLSTHSPLVLNNLPGEALWPMGELDFETNPLEEHNEALSVLETD